MIYYKNFRCKVNEYVRGAAYHNVERYDYVLGHSRQAIKSYSSELLLQSRSSEKEDYYTYGRLVLAFDVFTNPSSYRLRIEPDDFNYDSYLAIEHALPILTKLLIDDLGFSSTTQGQLSYYADSIYYLTRENDMSLDEFKDIGELLAQEITARLQEGESFDVNS